ncbi:unnamed protein product [Orchesella dallaii]
MFDEDTTQEDNKKRFEMTNGGEDLSILEYGPGIVKKLRSRYQSLALRQYAARPSLRRSTSLENCLDAVSAEELAATLESKISTSSAVQAEEGNDTDERQQRGRKLLSSQALDSSDFSRIQYQQNGSVGKGGSGGGPRGRTSGPDASARRDRMRRARSVDALHRTKREEEILEKFKHVVLPKEEIVIIEVSKPQHGSVISSATNGFNHESNGTGVGGEKRFPTRLLLTSNNLRNSAAVLDQQTANRVRNLISPEHELPPHDIVRETARIFEKNQENLNRRIGQALRLSKSHSTTSVVSSTGITSPPLTPPSPTPSTTSSTTTSQQKPVTAQGTTSSSMQPQDKSFATKTSGKVEANNPTAQTNGMANGPSHGQRQIGIIKPTLSNSGSVVVSSKICNGETPSKVDRVRSPILSPIGFSSSQKPLIQNSLKPPLSPKPIFTSSPKVNIPGGKANSCGPKSTLAQESPSTSPILIIERDPRSISPVKSASPIPVVNSSANSAVGVGDTGRSKSPVFAKFSVSPTEDRHEVYMRSPSPINGKLSPVDSFDGSGKRLGVNYTIARSNSPDEPSTNKIGEVKSKTASTTNLGVQNGQVSEKAKEVTKEQVRRTPSPVITETPSNNKGSQSQLRVHQKQKSSQGGNGSMVFNFTSRKDVPNYIEDDGLRRRGDGAPSEGEGISVMDKDAVDSKLPTFEGGNVIINGRSSIQKKPKSHKLNISFNEDATTTYEYPSESSLMIEEEPSESENTGPKKPSVVSGSSLGSYTPKVGTNTYQLGSYTTLTLDGSSGHKKSNGKQEDEENEFIEDYLKPNTESTTWSNEMSADILF